MKLCNIYLIIEASHYLLPSTLFRGIIKVSPHLTSILMNFKINYKIK